MRLFKQKILSLVTAVCMIATSAAPVFASEGKTAEVNDSGYVKAIWTDEGIKSVTFQDSGAGSTATPLTSGTAAKVPAGEGTLTITINDNTDIENVTVDEVSNVSHEEGSKVWTCKGTVENTHTESAPLKFTIKTTKKTKVDAVAPIFTTNLSSTDNNTYTVGAKPDTVKDLAVIATVTDGGAVTYQWYSNTTDSTSGGTEIKDATKESYKPLVDKEGTTYYYVVVTNTNKNATGTQTATATSKLAKITVTPAPVKDKVITSFKTSDLTLDEDLRLTTFAMVENAYPAYFSKTVTGICDDGSTVFVPVTSWACASYDGTAKEHIAIATLGTIPSGYKLGAAADGTEVAATITINVTVKQTAEKTITGFDNIAAKEGGNVGAIASGYEPDKVAATLLTAHKNVSATVDGQTVTIPVISWNCSNYDVTKADTYTFTATLNMAGYKLQDGVPAPTIKVTIAAKDKITLQEVEKPTVTLNSDEHLNTWAFLTASGKLPKTVKLTGANNETANAVVTWTDPSSYTGAVTDGLSISGTFALPSDWDNTAAALTTTLTLVVKVEQTTSTDGKTPVSTLNIHTDKPTSGMEISKWGVNVLETSATLADTSWSPSHTKFQAGTSYTLTATLTAETGYKFTNATTVNIIDGNSKTSSMSVSNRTDTSLTCSYTFPAVEAKYVTVKFLLDDGTTVHATQQVKENTILTSVPADPTKTAHTFIGWFTTDDEKGVQFDLKNTAFKDNTTLYAKFAPEVTDTQKKALKDAVQAENPAQAATAVEAIQDAANGDPAAVKEIIEKSGLSENDIKKLEKLYADGANIKSEGDVQNATQALPTGATIKVDGGELNATAPGQKVAIEVSDTHIDQEVKEEALAAHKIPADATVVSLDITLKVGNTVQSTSVTPITITMTLPNGIDANSKVVVLHILESGQIESIPVTINADGTFTFTVSSFSDFIVASTTKTIDPPKPPKPTPTPDNGNNNNSGGSGGSGGGGGGGSSGSNKSQSIFQKTTSTINNILKGWFGGASRKVTTGATGAAAVTGTPVTESAAAKAASSAASQAKAQGSNSFNAIVRNATTVSPKAFEAVASQAQKSGLKGYLAADTMKNGAVDVRVSVLASAASRLGKELNLYAVCGNPAIEKHFNKYFSNKTAVISMSQKGSFGVTVNVAAKVNLNGMNVKNLRIYSYDVASNSYRELPQEACFVDGNGYLHFTTDMGGYIVISDGVLTLH